MHRVSENLNIIVSTMIIISHAVSSSSSSSSSSTSSSSSSNLSCLPLVLKSMCACTLLFSTVLLIQLRFMLLNVKIK
uniref:Uncharacterized protein n=1 Tax=Octopus bimaculoides TaxID=37653 RepID=A0A0L8GLZ4_OCTBM